MSAYSSPAHRASCAAMRAALDAIPAPERMEPWSNRTYYTEAIELRERVGIYLGRDPDTLSEADVDEFAHISRWAVRHG
jgi:hypothetical protein